MADPKHDSSGLTKEFIDCKDIKILDSKFSILCRCCNTYIGSQGFSGHLLAQHNISRIEYAWKHHTDEICNCAVCNKNYFRSYGYIRLRLKNTCNNKKCMNQFRKMSIEKSFLKKYGFKNSFVTPHIQKKVIENSKKTLKSKNIYHICALKRAENLRKKGLLSVIGKKTLLKKRQNGYYTEKFLVKRSESAIKGVNTRKSKGAIFNRLVSLKISETRKKNGTYNKSNPESKFGSFLSSKFNCVHNQISINSNEFIKLFGLRLEDYKKSFTFDFAVVEDGRIIFICIDGIYYHGLDRPIVEIANLRTKTDKTIFETYYRDRYLEDYISSKNMCINVVKFSDVSITNFLKNKTEKMLPYYCNGESNQLDSFWRKFYG
jgi:hypothetical protein